MAFRKNALETDDNSLYLEGCGITLDGRNLGSHANGITLVSGNNVIANLSFVNIPWTSIDITGPNASENLVQGCEIQTDSSLYTRDGYYGIRIQEGASNNIIGGGAGNPNVILGQEYACIVIRDSETLNNVVSGNFVSLNPDASFVWWHTRWGIAIIDSPGNVIGGSTVSERNVISGLASAGIAISGQSAVDNTIVGNYIGTDPAGMLSIPNGYIPGYYGGIVIADGACGNRIGGIDAGAGNLISGNASGYAITLMGDAGLPTAENIIKGNRIGLDAAGELGQSH